VEEHQLEGQPSGAPEGTVRTKADVPELIVGQALEGLGEAGRRLLVRCAGKLLGAGGDIVETEGASVGTGIR